MYKFFDDETEKIIKKNKISDYLIIFENDDFIKYKRGLDELAYHTCKILDDLNSVDDYGTFLLAESMRFFIYCFRFQRSPNNVYEDYYITLLNKFHELGYLLFKESIRPYKTYKNKKYTFKVNYNLDNEEVQLVYYSLKNMRIDFGRYRTERITATYPKQSSLDYNFISALS